MTGIDKIDKVVNGQDRRLVFCKRNTEKIGVEFLIMDKVVFGQIYACHVNRIDFNVFYLLEMLKKYP